MKKLCVARRKGCAVDGHAPELSGKELNAYLCGGIKTDHECMGEKEIEEKIARGMYVHIREGSATRNAAANAKAVRAETMRRFILCTDDRHACDLKRGGHIDNVLRILVQNGVNPLWAVTMGTLNTAECYGLKGLRRRRAVVRRGYRMRGRSEKFQRFVRRQKRQTRRKGRQTAFRMCAP